MKKLITLIGLMLIIITFFATEKSKANSCFLASEGGASGNCDNGTAQTGLPVHNMTTTSKKGTTGLCNNVNVFADEKQAKEYAKTHEYDGIYVENGCYKPKCTYESDCSIGTKTCCKSLINEKCWHECDICTFNKIGGDFYPYADAKLEGCKLVGEDSMNQAVAVIDKYHTNRHYKINGLRNLEPLGDINTSIWKCNLNEECKKYAQNTGNEENEHTCDNVETILSDCKHLIGRTENCVTNSEQTKYIVGFNEQSTFCISYLCLNGVHHSLSKSADNFVNKYGCPLSAIQCNEDKGYYRDEERCQRKSLNNNPCSVVQTYRGYGDSECWHKAERCSDFGYGDYRTGNLNKLDCSDQVGTSAQPYTNKVTGSTVTLNGVQCGACECILGTTRVSKCNSLFYEVIRGYFDSNKTESKLSSCEKNGYTETKPSGNNCTACPYNATYWKCD